ncbi:hypothetical protein SMC26_28365 [Actinomadura fulvescens]|uniref:Uncharacterized protein n=1 Tax=Actinomadura fulvescens TaxID=46160 RepID=A0ABN3PBR9_9ACTN
MSIIEHPPDWRQIMALRLVGGDDESEGGGSPAVWVDTETYEIVVQGLTGDDPTRAAARATGKLTPDHESIIRFPDRLYRLLVEAHDVIAELRGDIRGDAPRSES